MLQKMFHAREWEEGDSVEKGQRGVVLGGVWGGT